MEPLWVIVYLVQWVVLLVLSLLVFSISQEITELHGRLDILHKVVIAKSNAMLDERDNGDA